MIRLIVGWIFMALMVTGCEREDPQPHLKDPIFKDLKAKADSYQKSVEDAQKELAGLKLELEKAEANSIEQKDARRKIASTQAGILQNTQWARYYKIRSDRRVVMDKVDAHTAFEDKKEWPDPAEYSDYLTNKRLREVSPNWNKRVPKLQDRLSKPAAKKEEGEESAAATPAPEGH